MTVLLEADHVRVEYGALVAVGGVSFQLSGGDLLGLIGPNGAGKTTLLRVLAGLQAPTCGSSRIMGHDVLYDSDAVRGRVAFAPDAPPAYEDMTVEYFLRFIAEAHQLSGHEAQERIDYWLEQVWLAEKRGELIRNLSKGMRQRVTIAQVLLTNSTVVLLDEPSTGLDPAGRIQLRKVIASLRDHGKAIIVSSHILADLEEYCTHIAILEHGRLLRFSAVSELHHTTDNRCRYSVRTAGLADQSELIGGIEGVGDLVREDHVYTFEYSRGDEAAHRLLKGLVDRGVPVVAFSVLRDSLETVYLKTGVRQVD